MRTKKRNRNNSTGNIVKSRNGYTSVILKDLTVVVFHFGKELWRAGPFDNKMKAREEISKFIETKSAPTGAITLDVKSMSIDADTLFGGKQDG